MIKTKLFILTTVLNKKDFKKLFFFFITFYKSILMCEIKYISRVRILMNLNILLLLLYVYACVCMKVF